MSSITYNGHDLSQHVTAELVEPAGHALSPRTLAVPGRPGAVLLGSELPPRVFRVRLFMDAGISLGADERSEIRHELYGWLCAPDGAELELPGEPGLTWRDAVVTDASGWDSLFEDGSCELAFTCLDPVAYGDEVTSAGTALTGTSVKVADGLGRYVLVERTFAAGDVVVMDFAAEVVTADGVDASADVAVESTFFSLSPGSHSLVFSGCSTHTVAWTERWL